MLEFKIFIIIFSSEAEKYFQNVFYLIFKLLGFYAEVERSTSDGRLPERRRQ